MAKVHYSNTDLFLLEWGVILFLFIVFAYPETFVVWSWHSLGKFIVVLWILYLTTLDPYYGLLFCCIAIIYYEMIYESHSAAAYSNYSLEQFYALKRETEESFSGIITPSASLHRVRSVEGYTSGVSDIYQYVPFASSESSNTNETNIMQHGKRELLEHFRKSNCRASDNQLMFKGRPVHNEHAAILFDELQFTDGIQCNPCSPDCPVNILDKKLQMESRLRAPVNSHDASVDWNAIYGDYVVSPINSILNDVRSYGEWVESISKMSFSK